MGNFDNAFEGCKHYLNDNITNKFKNLNMIVIIFEVIMGIFAFIIGYLSKNII